MRKFQATFPIEIEFNKVGKITLGILLVILTVLIYAKAEAKEVTPKSVFVKNAFTEEIRKNIETGEVKRSVNKQFENTSVIDIKITGEKNEIDRVLFQANPLYAQTEKNVSQIPTKEVSEKLVSEVKNLKNESQEIDESLREDVARELKGTKMEPMIDFIASNDRQTAALLVGIARIESGYSHNYSYNFWGYAGGYYGFKNPEQAVSVVSERIIELQNQGLNTPAKIVTTWKCGRSCASHAPGSVQRWVSTVSGPYNRIAMNK